MVFRLGVAVLTCSQPALLFQMVTRREYRGDDVPEDTFMRNLIDACVRRDRMEGDMRRGGERTDRQRERGGGREKEKEMARERERGGRESKKKRWQERRERERERDKEQRRRDSIIHVVQEPAARPPAVRLLWSLRSIALQASEGIQNKSRLVNVFSIGISWRFGFALPL